jgi:hypothetical protein
MAPGTAVAPTGSQDPSAATITTTPTVVAGHYASVSGRLTDPVSGLPVAGASVFLCHRTAVQTTGSCTSARTGSTGIARVSTRQYIRTAWWLVFPGTSALAASASRTSIVYVKTAVSVTATGATSGWWLHASFSPVRGQVVRLQVRTASGWRTLVKTPLRAGKMSFHVGRGHYVVWTAAVTGLLPSYVYITPR